MKDSSDGKSLTNNEIGKILASDFAKLAPNKKAVFEKMSIKDKQRRVDQMEELENKGYFINENGIKCVGKPDTEKTKSRSKEKEK
jgi:hypothetical protein